MFSVPGRARRTDLSRHANNRIEVDRSRLEHRLRAMPGLLTGRTAWMITARHAFMQDLRRGHHELRFDVPPGLRLLPYSTNSLERPDPRSKRARRVPRLDNSPAPFTSKG